MLLFRLMFLKLLLWQKIVFAAGDSNVLGIQDVVLLKCCCACLRSLPTQAAPCLDVHQAHLLGLCCPTRNPAAVLRCLRRRTWYIWWTADGLLLQVLGSRRGPLHCVVGAQSIGPMLEFGADLASMTMEPEMAFGNVEVLQVQLQGLRKLPTCGKHWPPLLSHVWAGML